MQNKNYSFFFEPVQNQSNTVRFIDHSNGKLSNFELYIDDSQLRIDDLDIVPSLSADLLDLALAIHAVDRLVKRQRNKICSFRVELPIWNLDIFLRKDVSDNLFKLLEWYTGDHWHFDFIKRNALGRPVESQTHFIWNKSPSQQTEIALWSGGLDSFSGLYNRLLSDEHTHYVLIGTGANKQVLASQRELKDTIQKIFPDRISLIQIPYFWSDFPIIRRNFDQRSRGLVFMLIGAACAYHYGQNSLYIYENGPGAINLPYSKAEVGLDHSKSVHPLSLLYLGEFVSTVIGNQFDFLNPFLFWTKSQMCECLIKNNATDLIHLTSSCDRPRRLPQGVTQCGVCSSCLLRRQSINALGIIDPTTYENNGNIDRKNDSHLRAMIYQVRTMQDLLKHPDPWYAFSKEYYELDDIVDQISRQDRQEISCLRRQIIQLYSKYVDEWKLFEKHIEKNASRDVVTYASS